ncbi:Heterokaryon incompatibility protein 6, OR allele [Fusarium oxysporum f. sp. cubense]|uniref:Heterokaryon incompatibility protein 6, OR allele n=1 Tax=Fusarium oxysporum f. sp. cubense TaxID=61366 RepID=A0A559L434_FUSOC|nr:Heterokaryon incompatibility protein 6, OR allele [Fusarium oxysporum f. sp. cubense]
MGFTGGSWKKERDLFELVCSTKSCHATDPRDKIFALIGLVGDKTYGIVPDYHKNESEVFTEFALKVISETKKLAIQNYSDVEDPNHKEQLPLWAPRWHSKDWPDFYDMSDYGFKCSNNMEIALGSPINTQVLHLKGLYVDKV